jgi:hypothetical protein
LSAEATAAVEAHDLDFAAMVAEARERLSEAADGDGDSHRGPRSNARGDELAQ